MRSEIRTGEPHLVEQRANLDYGRDERRDGRRNEYLVIDDDGVIVTTGIYEVTDGLDDDALYDWTAESDYVIQVDS
jgi:hypothetical protein